MPRLAHLPVLLLACLATACGGGDGGSAASKDDAREALASVRPIESATAAVRVRITLDNPPADVGTAPIDLTLDGPLRSNGAGKLASFDWKVGFSGFGQSLESRFVSTGSNVYVRLGGQDFEVGTQAVAQATQGAGGTPGAGSGLAAIGIDPLGAIEQVEEAGAGTVAGATTTRYTGKLSSGMIADQVARLLGTVRAQQPAGGTQVPSLDLTPERRRDIERAFAAPSFTAEVAEDRTLRRIVVATRFTTPEANRAAAGGTTGGTLEYRAEYSDVGKTVAVTPPADAEPIQDFVAALQELVAKRDDR